MAKEIPITDEHMTMLYDSATNQTVHPEKVVDISDECPEEKPLLVFAKVKRGRLVQIVRGCTRVHFFVDELDQERKTWDNPFGLHASLLGMSETALQSLIVSNSPSM